MADRHLYESRAADCTEEVCIGDRLRISQRGGGGVWINMSSGDCSTRNYKSMLPLNAAGNGDVYEFPKSSSLRNPTPFDIWRAEKSGWTSSDI